MYRKILNNNLLSIIIFVLFLFLLYKNFLLNLNNTLLFNDGDPLLNLYFLKWGADYLLGSLNISYDSIFNLPVAFPYENSLALSDNLFGNQIIFLPYYILTDNPLLAFNLWILTTYFLNYYLMFSYLKHSKFVNNSDNLLVPIIGAIVFSFSIPSFDLLGGHLQLLPLYAIPISLFLLEKSMISLKTRYFILFGLAISFQFYLGIHTGFILLVLLMFLVPVYYHYLVEDKRSFLKRIWISVATFALPTLILLMPYLESSKLTGHRTYADVKNYIPSVINFFSTGIGEKAIFVGIPVFLLFIVSIYLMHKKKSKILLIAVVLSFLFFLKETHIFQLFFTFIPGFDSIRTPGRFVLVSISLIAIFISTVFVSLDVKKIRYLFFIFIFCMSVSLYQKSVLSMNYKYYDDINNTKLLKIINHKPTLILPLYKFKNPEIFYIIKRMKDSDMQFPILDIYSGFNPSFIDELETQYVDGQKTIIDSENFISRILKLGFVNILLEKEKTIHPNIIEVLDKHKKFKKVYEDEKTVLYSYNICKKTSLSLNETLKNSSWQFKMESFKSLNNHTVFIGSLKGRNLSGVVQKKEELVTIVNIEGNKYPCKLQLDKIKDSFSSFECILKYNYPEFSTIDNPLNNPKVKLDILNFPKVEKTNTIYKIKVKVTNLSKEVLNSIGKYPVSLSYKIYDDKGKELQLLGIGSDGEPLRSPFKFGLLENKTRQITMLLKTPYKSGNYVVEIDMVQDGAFWFKEKGNRVIKKSITIGEKE